MESDFTVPSRIEDSSHPTPGQRLDPLELAVEDPGLKLAPYGVGIDCHSRFIQVCVYAQTGGAYLRFEEEFSTRWEDLTRAKQWIVAALTSVGHVVGSSFRYTLESTGCYHLPVCLAWGGEPCLVNPTLASPSRRKTDTLDARLLAYHALTGLWPATYLAPSHVQTLRVLMAARKREVRRATQSLNRINNLLLRFGHTVGSYVPLSRMDVRPLVEDLLEGRPCPPLRGVSTIPVPEPVVRLIQQAYSEYDAAKRKATDLTKQAAGCARLWTVVTERGEIGGAETLNYLCSVPAVGEVTALTWLAEVGDWRRFPTSKAAAAYAGCDPSLKVSAGHVTSQVRRRGNENLHAALVQAAQYAVRTATEPFGQWGRRLWLGGGKGGWQRAVGAVARRLAMGLYWVHRKGEFFTYEGYGLALRPEIPLDISVQEMGLPAGVLRVVLRQGWATSGDIVTAADKGFRAYPGVGQKTAEVLSNWLKTQLSQKGRKVSASGASCSPGNV